MKNNLILDGLQYRAAEGNLAFNQVRYLLIRAETVIEFQKAVEAEVGFEKCSEMIYYGGFAGGSLSSKKYREAFGKTDRETAQFMCEMGGQIGWGRFELVQYDAQGQSLTVRVTHSPFAQTYGSSPDPVCHFIRGVVGGMASVVLAAEHVVSEETVCSAGGQAACLFTASAVH